MTATPGTEPAVALSTSSAYPASAAHAFALADELGYVRVPDIDLGDQMTQLMIAQRGYQANLSVVKHAQDAYTSALQLGKRS